MLPSALRLKKRKDFENIFNQRQGSVGKFFILKKVANNLIFSRFAFIVSNKTCPRATARNRVKRQVSEIVRLNLKKIKPGFDIVFIVKQAALNKKQAEIATDLIFLLKKNGLI